MAGRAQETVNRIIEGKAADIRFAVPARPEPLATQFADLLNSNPGRRLSVATQMYGMLEGTKAALHPPG
jgi:hypothetical protein